MFLKKRVTGIEHGMTIYSCVLQIILDENISKQTILYLKNVVSEKP